jgi:hypothetical protein
LIGSRPLSATGFSVPQRFASFEHDRRSLLSHEAAALVRMYFECNVSHVLRMVLPEATVKEL